MDVSENSREIGVRFRRARRASGALDALGLARLIFRANSRRGWRTRAQRSSAEVLGREAQFRTERNERRDHIAGDCDERLT